ncbi:hypothetical protein Syun_023970 [Stephania yunnanensis]|uniref:Uncharacterized protein n=1 Tax=Stephania yunnanensis TaxID=152371 RepID=A0AAP0FAX0_9MAGN
MTRSNVSARTSGLGRAPAHIAARGDGEGDNGQDAMQAVLWLGGAGVEAGLSKRRGSNNKGPTVGWQERRTKNEAEDGGFNEPGIRPGNQPRWRMMRRCGRPAAAMDQEVVWLWGTMSGGTIRGDRGLVAAIRRGGASPNQSIPDETQQQWTTRLEFDEARRHDGLLAKKTRGVDHG